MQFLHSSNCISAEISFNFTFALFSCILLLRVFLFFSSLFLFRYTLNSIAVIFIVFSVLFDLGVWYYVKELKIFDEDEIYIQLKSKKEQRTINASNSTKLEPIDTK